MVTSISLAVAFLAAAVGRFAFEGGAPAYGVTFSSSYARELGLDAAAAYTAVIEELNVNIVRIPVPWDRVAPLPGVNTFDEIDAMLDIAAENDAQVMLAVGYKVPRWPECAIPDWASALDNAAFTDALLTHLDTVVTRYKEHPALARWQVENEPLFPFGECPVPDIDRLRAEIALVRRVDPSHPILLTSSGEQSSWLELAASADIVGVSLYRFAWNDAMGPVAFPHTPLYYRLHRGLVRATGKDALVSELQMEPWFAEGVGNDAGTTIPFSSSDFREHVLFVEETGMEEAWLWGVEWWYRERLAGRPELWDAARDVFSR